jgi:hypothetical protein
MAKQPPIFLFDIETVPDVAAGKIYLPEPDGGWASDEAIGRAMFAERLNHTNGKSSFLKHHHHRIVAISAVFRSENAFKVGSIGDLEDGEAEILRKFFAEIEKHHPFLVDWNGGSFDLPVIQLRSMIHGVVSRKFWDVGGEAKWDNYHDRYCGRHMDIMDMLGRFSVKTTLDDFAMMMGFPGKLGMSGDKVYDAFLEGRIGDIRNYCDHDVLNTYLVFLRLELIRGRLTEEQYATEQQVVRDYLAESGKPHHLAFLEAWEAA